MGDDLRRVAFELDDGCMAGIAWGDQSRAPDILFLHATGFNARTYRALLEPLGGRFHVVAVDLRGHGRSTLKPRRLGYVSWRRHRDDVVALLERHFTEPVTLAGHSMGATTSLLVAGRRPDLVRGLALIEPVILSAAQYSLFELPFGNMLGAATLPIARKARSRRAHFASREEAVMLLGKRGVFRDFPLESLVDYVADGFVEDKAGVRLACSPAYEAATFAAQRHDPWAAIKRAPEPIVLLRAETGSSMSGSAAHRFAALRPDARLATVEGATHMLPITRPDRARAAIETAALMATPTKTFRDLD
ncbi:MAG TPA: alpha/beta hydrolase [Caulobacterales bacterium]|nr:alpha/beta hydrolase [Caulobacterales bacterium]